MSKFIELRSTTPAAIAKYKREVRAITIDRAAQHMQTLLDAHSKPTKHAYEKALKEGLLRAKLDVMAELFEHMQHLARPRPVTGWNRENGGLQRRNRTAQTAFSFIIAYDQIVRFVANLKLDKAAP